MDALWNRMHSNAFLIHVIFWSRFLHWTCAPGWFYLKGKIPVLFIEIWSQHLNFCASKLEACHWTCLASCATSDSVTETRNVLRLCFTINCGFLPCTKKITPSCFFFFPLTQQQGLESMHLTFPQKKTVKPSYPR